MPLRALAVVVSLVVIFSMVLPVMGQEIRTYTVNKVRGVSPTIDGNFSEAEWAGSEWTDEFVGTRHDWNYEEFWSAKVDTNYRWRALWDEEYLYVVMTGDLKYVNSNGMYWDPNAGEEVSYDPPFVLLEDDVPNDNSNPDTAWNMGQCIDFELFIVPKWTEDLGNDATLAPAHYHFIYFPLHEWKDASGNVVNPSNFGFRGPSGPPFFSADYAGDSAKYPGAPTWVFPPDYADPTYTVEWHPITDPVLAQEKGVKTFLLAALEHAIAGAKLGTDVVAQPVVEVAFPFSQFTLAASWVTFTITNPDTGEQTTETRNLTMEEVPYDGMNVILEKDAQGHWVKAGDQWLLNLCAYTDGVTASTGLSLINWNDMVDGGFHNWPKGILTFAVPVPVTEWMMY